MVLMIGKCTRCAMSELGPADYLATNHPEIDVVGVSPTGPAEAEQFRRENHLHLRIVCLTSDASRRLAEEYNAAWNPRAYLLSPSGALLWRQPSAVLDLQSVAGALSAGGRK